jgi:hypothetical protein
MKVMSINANLTYHVFKDYNVVFDEKGSKFGTIRKVQWVREGKEPEEDKAKIEIRHMVNTAEGEQFGKGYAFDTEEGPHELTEALVECGFGSTKEILRKLTHREDFKDSVENFNKEEEISDGEMFDMRDLMLFSEEEEDIDETA